MKHPLLPPPPTGPAPVRSGSNVDGTSTVGVPTMVVIPRLGISSSLLSLGLNTDGTLEVPPVASEAGWYSDGPRPGERGPAVIVGHVDSYTGPGIFWNLRSLIPGDVITVESSAGDVLFRTDRVEQVAKASFPTSEVFGGSADPELRLVTCGGAFDRATGHYVDNVIVFATEISGSGK